MLATTTSSTSDQLSDWRRTSGPGIIAALFWLILVFSLPAHAEPQVFDIEPQSLADALREYSRETGIQVIYDPADVTGKNSPGLQGTLEPADALSQLLEGAGLEYREVSENTFTIVAPTQAISSVSPSHVAFPPSPVEEVIVTAARRAQPANDLPLSVSVLNGQELVNAGYMDFAEATTWVPSVMTPGGATAGRSYVMRGLTGTSNGGRSIDTLIDGATASSNFYEANPAILDFERIEVVRGSQGTYYGQNSLAGVIKFVSVRPQYEELEGHIAARSWSTSSGDDSWRGNAVVNLPLGDRVAARLGASYESQGGFVDNYSIDPETLLPVDLLKKNINSLDRKAFRGAISWLATDRFELYLTGRLQSVEAPASSLEKLQRIPPGGDELQPFDDYVTTSNITDFAQVFRSDDTIGTLEASYDFDSMTLTSVTTFYQQENLADYTVVSVFPGDIQVTQTIYSSQKQTNRSQEFRLTSSGDDRVEWIAGAYWRNEDWWTTSDFDNLSSGVLITQLQTIEREQFSLYGNVQYAITDKVALEAGLRWFTEDLDRYVTFAFVFPGTEPSPTERTGGGTFETTSPRLALLYSPTDQIMLFAGVSRGFRGGTVNLPDFLPPELRTADPDSNWSYELGIKGQWLDGRLTSDIVLFYNDWEDIQVRVNEVIDEQPVTVVVNGESAETVGAEWQLNWLPIDSLALSLTGHLMDSELTESIRGEQGPSGAGIRAGNELVNAPRWGFTIAGDWARPFAGNREAYASLRIMARDGHYSSLGNEPVSRTPRFSQGNAALGLRIGAWDFSVWATNIWNERAYNYQQGAFGFDEVGFGEVIMPRRVGLALQYDF